MWYHGQAGSEEPPETKRQAKECRVRDGWAHAALVYQRAECVGWCPFGSSDELPRSHNARAYLKGNPTLPDWRITCIFSIR